MPALGQGSTAFHADPLAFASDCFQDEQAQACGRWPEVQSFASKFELNKELCHPTILQPWNPPRLEVLTLCFLQCPEFLDANYHCLIYQC